MRPTVGEAGLFHDDHNIYVHCLAPPTLYFVLVQNVYVVLCLLQRTQSQLSRHRQVHARETRPEMWRFYLYSASDPYQLM